MAKLVVRRESKPLSTFGTIPVGSVFQIVDDNDVLLKIERSRSEIGITQNALDLANFQLYEVDDDSEVNVLQSELTLYK
jgi:hypothetical protein